MNRRIERFDMEVGSPNRRVAAATVSSLSRPARPAQASSGTKTAYLFQEPALRVREAYGPQVYERLVTLKDRYDPDNFSRLNQNVRPSRLAGWCGEPAARLRAVT